MPSSQQAAPQVQPQTPSPAQPATTSPNEGQGPLIEQPPPPDLREKGERNLYSTPYHSIIFRNFLAGAARALGGIVLYIIFLLFMGWIASTYILPQLKPIFSAFESLSNLQPGSPTQPKINPNQLNQLMQQLGTPPPTN